jgi:L-aspartate oxidase
MTPSRTAEARPARVLVVGSGIAGLTAALTAASCGAEVVIVTTARVDAAATTRAQGGIAGVIFPDDALADHAADTMRASAGLADPDAVRALVAGGTEAIAWLIDHGVRFDRDAAGRLEGGLEGAHSYPRILHAGGDATGAEIERALVAAVRAAGIGVRERTMLADIALRDGSAVGAHLMDPDGTVHAEAADAVILATGGAGQAYARTTNPVVATGDGIAAALRAGADVAGMEFVQFHPTVLAAGEPFLVSEAVRGEGAVLLDEAGSRPGTSSHARSPTRWRARAAARCSSTPPASVTRSRRDSRRSTAPCASEGSTGRASRSPSRPLRTI